MRATRWPAMCALVVLLTACTTAEPSTDPTAPPARVTASPSSVATPSPEPLPDGYDVVAVLGQSNALGWGLGADEPAADEPDPRIWQWPGSGPDRDTVAPAADPLVGPFVAVGVGPAMSFAREYVAEQDREVLIVQTAVNGTGFAPSQGMSWDPDADGSVRNLYVEAVDQVRGALAEGAGNRLVAILWVQGESDVGRLTEQEYADELDAMIALLRADLGPAPFVVGQMTPEWIGDDPARQAIDAVHRGTPARVPNSVFVAGPTGATNGAADLIHYDALGQREQGRRMYAAWARLSSAAP